MDKVLLTISKGAWRRVATLSRSRVLLPSYQSTRARIAGVLTKFHNPDAQVVSKAMLGNGITISLHYATTALRLHGASRIKVEILDAQLLLEWIREKHDQGLITLPDVVQTGPNRIRDTATARRLIAVLVQHRYLRAGGAENGPWQATSRCLEIAGIRGRPR